MSLSEYHEFIDGKSHISGNFGFDPLWLPDFLFDFQKALVEWAIRKGRAAIFADCGLGKSVQQLVWAENVVRKTNGNVLILTPLAVSSQTVREGEKFGIEATQSRDGTVHRGITVTNYEKLHLFHPGDFVGVVCDESSILKSFDGARKSEITDFMKKLKYRLLCTATASPNDYIELGTSSEALGDLGYMDMLGMFFKNDQNSLHPATRTRHYDLNMSGKWRFKMHAEHHFWRWVCSWARAIRRPSDLGFDDRDFILPELIVNQRMVNVSRPMSGRLFSVPAVGLKEQRDERRHTIQERCEAAANLVDHDRPAIVWCHLNPEGDLLEKLIPDGKQISGKHSDEKKEELFDAFTNGQLRTLITKPKIGAWGMNWQHCNHVVTFSSHSFEQYYQSVRRCWRFGQKLPVTVDVVTTEGESNVQRNLQRKSEAADKMFDMLVKEMNNAMSVERSTEFELEGCMPSWM